MTSIFIAFFALVFMHFLFDYPLQGDFLSRAKNRRDPIMGVPWYQAMTAHSFMHGAAVFLVLGVWWIALLEMAAHFVIDDHKCRGELTFNQDQALHVGLKAVWVALALFI